MIYQKKKKNQTSLTIRHDFRHSLLRRQPRFCRAAFISFYKFFGLTHKMEKIAVSEVITLALT